MLHSELPCKMPEIGVHVLSPAKQDRPTMHVSVHLMFLAFRRRLSRDANSTSTMTLRSASSIVHNFLQLARNVCL